ncbi:MAG: autotransporter domain-containing protein [Pseudomonadota bacterium]
MPQNQNNNRQRNPSMQSSPRPARRAALYGLCAGLAVAGAPALADTYEVNSEAALRNAILTANGTAGPHFIEFQGDIVLTASLPPVLTTMTIKGRGYSLDGDSQYQLLSIGNPGNTPGPRILVLVNDLALANGRVEGGDGATGGGGGLGAGGAVFVGARADVVLNNVEIRDSLALGGHGSAGNGGDGGGINGGSGTAGSGSGDGDDGSFGAGGGSGTGLGGDGGMGAGGGAGAAGGGSGGTGGGDGGLNGGGGGAGLGGAIFVTEGGGLTLAGRTHISGNASVAGVGAADGSDGNAAGSGLFLQGSGNLMVRGPSSGQLQVIADDIADAWGAGLSGAQSWERWNLIVSGGARDGFIALGGNNSYSGDTYILGSTLVVQQDENLGGTDGIVVLDDGGLGMGDGFTLTRDVVVNSGGGSFTLTDDGTATLAGNLNGEGTIVKNGEGDLALLSTTNFTGIWSVEGGALVLDDDSRLGNTQLFLRGGGLRFTADEDALRGFTVSEGRAFLDNGGHDVTVDGDIYGWLSDSSMVFQGGGDTVIAGSVLGDGHTVIEAGHVTGDIASGDLDVQAGAAWTLGGGNRSVSGLEGGGLIHLGSQRLTVAMPSGDEEEEMFQFDGVIDGTGGLTVTNTGSGGSDPLMAMGGDQRTLVLTGTNTYGGGTRIQGGAVLSIGEDGNLGTGPVTLAGGTLRHGGSVTDLDFVMNGGGVIRTSSSLTHTGNISGNGTLVKTGQGTLTLTTANTFTGATWVIGENSYLALQNPGGINGSLNLSQGGGLRLLANNNNLMPLYLQGGVGILDTGAFNAVSNGAIYSVGPDSAFTKYGNGTLTITGNSAYSDELFLGGGTLQLGTGGTTGTVGGNVVMSTGTHLVFNRAGLLDFSGSIVGDGDVTKTGTGTVFLSSDLNGFSGGLDVLGGRIAVQADTGLGTGPILLDGGGLELRGSISRNVTVGATFGEIYTPSAGHSFAGAMSGDGVFIKSGDGTMILTGMVDVGGGNHVTGGVLHVGDGFSGLLFGDTLLDDDTTLRFGRDDNTFYEGVVSGTGSILKNSAGELILLGDSVNTGMTLIEGGDLRLGNGGTTGSLTSDITVVTGTRLLFDRSDDIAYDGVLTGGGTVVHAGVGRLLLSGDGSAHTGATEVLGGTLALDGIAGGDLTVFAGALEGIGRVGGNLDLQGTSVLRASNTTTAFRVDGNLLMAEGMRWEIDIAPGLLADRIDVGGTAQLAGAVAVNSGGAAFTAGDRFRLLDAAGISGTFTRLDEDLAFLDGELVYGTDFVELLLVRNDTPLGSIDLTRNQQAVADALEQMPEDDPLVMHVLGLDEAEARDAFDAFSGDSLLAGVSVPNRLGNVFAQALQRRGSRLGLASRGPDLDELMSAGFAALAAGSMLDMSAASASVSRVEGVWLETGAITQTEDVDSVTGNAATEFDGTLLSLGFDGYWRDDLILGAAIGQGSGSVAFGDRDASGDLDGTFLGFYGRWDLDSQLHLKFSLTAGSTDATLERTVPVGAPLAATSSTQLLGASLEAGMPLRAGHWGLRPYGQLLMQQLDGGGYTERGGPAALTVAGTQLSQTQFGIGVEASRPWLPGGNRWAQVQASAGLIQPLGDTQASQTAHFAGSTIPFTVYGAPEDGATFVLSAGGEWYLARNLALWLGYQGRFGSSDEQNVLASINARW